MGCFIFETIKIDISYNNFTIGQGFIYITSNTEAKHDQVNDNSVLLDTNLFRLNEDYGAVTISDYLGYVSVEGCTFDGNYGYSFSPGLHIDNAKGGNYTVSRSRFTNNNGNVGGAVILKGEGNYQSSVYFYLCDFIDNHSKQEGGAISQSHTEIEELNLKNCTFTRNSARYEGGALHIGGTTK
eukprot:UN24780